MEQCLNIQPDEYTVVVNDGNDPELVDALIDVLEEDVAEYDYMEYEEPDRHGEEPPEAVEERLIESEVFIAPTKKSISHTEARSEATAEGARGATLPGVNREVWTSSLLADYTEVRRVSESAFDLLKDTQEVHVETSSGTDLSFETNEEYCNVDTGMIRDPGDFGNLPAGEAFCAPLNASGELVIDHFPYAPEGTVVDVEDNRAVAVKHPGGESSELVEAFEDVQDARNIAEFGIGTNPEADLIGNTLQDEKVLGTVHVAFGDNSSMVGEGEDRVEAGIHWDAVFESPTVSFDGTPVIENGEPLFTQV